MGTNITRLILKKDNVESRQKREDMKSEGRFEDMAVWTGDLLYSYKNKK